MVTHRLFASHIYFTSQLNVLDPSLFFTGQLNVLAFHDIFFFFFYCCWPTQRVGLSFIIIFFTGQLNVLAYYTAARWISSAFALPHAREILLEMLTIDSNKKLDAVQFLEHVRIPRQNLINLIRPMPSRRPFTKLLSLVPNGNTASRTKSPTRKSLGLTSLLYARATLALFSLIFFQRPKP